MATKQPTIKDIFNNIKSGFSSAPIAPQTGFSMRTQTLPNQGGSFKTPTLSGPMSKAPLQPVPPIISKTNTPVASANKSVNSAPLFSSKTTNAPSSNPSSGVPPQWINPETGGFYSPEEVADNLAKSAPGLGNGDIPKFAGDTLTEGPQTAEQLQNTAAGLNNARNDIAVGESDPYKVGNESGIAYTPAELAAVEKAYAGVYDPAINSALAKLEARQKEDEQKRQDESDLKKMAIQFEYDKKLKSIGSGGGPGNSNQMTDNERAAQTLFQNNPIVKDYNTVVSQKNSIDNIIKNGTGGPADVSAIFSFMKALDPNSVVRESEFETAAKSGNLFQGIYTKFNGYFKDKGGILPENVKNEFQNLINQKLAAQAMSYQNLATQTKEIARRQNMNPDNVVIDFSLAVPQNTGATDADWISKPDYDNDLRFAREAIANGADANAVKQRLLTKYKSVEL